MKQNDSSRKPSVEPYISADRSLPEITIKAVLLGIVLSVVLGAANVYLGLKVGMTVAASIPAAVISMGILRLFKRSNILENNIVQTAASAGESLAAGVVFTLPALILLDAEFNYVQTTIIALLGGVIGVLYTVPLRRALVVESDLTFPEGVATAEVLKVGDQGGGVLTLLAGGIAGALFKFGSSGLKLFGETAEGAMRMGGSVGYMGINLAPALVGVGFIVGLNIAALVFIGGAANFFVAIPITAAQSDWPTYQLESEQTEAQKKESPWTVFTLEQKPVTDDMTADQRTAVETHNAEVDEQIGTEVPAVDYAMNIWSKRTRYVGVGAMLLGGIWALLRIFKQIFAGVSASLAAYRHAKQNAGESVPRTERDMPINWLAIALLVSAVPVFFVFHSFDMQWWVAGVMTGFMLIAGFLFSALASYMGGLVGSSNNPVSGVTIATLLTAALLLLAMGVDPQHGPVAAILIGAVVCCAAAIGGDNMQDLKAGQLVGATPWKQQVMQIVGVMAGALVMVPVLKLLVHAYGIGDVKGITDDPLPAPQAHLMADVAKGVFARDLPWDMVGIGAGIALLVIAIDVLLEKRNASFRTPVLAVAVGLYLPLYLGTALLVGGFVAFAVNRFHLRRIDNLPEAKQAEGELQSSLDEVAETGKRGGLLFAAGLITGEALLGILLAIPIVIYKGQNPLEIGPDSPSVVPGLLLMVVVVAALFIIATRGKHTE